MNQRFLMWGLASIAFIVTLAISSWHEGLWPYNEAPTPSDRAASLASPDPVSLPAQPFAPEHPAHPAATPILIAATPPQPEAPQHPASPAPAPEETVPPIP